MKKFIFTSCVLLLACFVGYSQTISLQLNPSKYNGGYNVSCQSSTNGSIDLIVIGGTAPFTFHWSNSATTQNLTDLAAGTYTVTVTDAVNASATENIELLKPMQLEIGLETTNVTQYGENNGSVYTTINGGTPPYTYLWSNGSTATDIKGLAPGSYTVTVTDMNSCTAAKYTTITQPSQLVITNLSSPLIHGYNVSCYKGEDGSISVTASGGIPPYIYEWNTGATTSSITGVSAGVYYVKVFGQNKSAAVTGEITLTQPDEIGVKLLPSVFTVGNNEYNISCYNCYNGTITATMFGGTSPFTYEWDDGTTTQNRTGLGPAVYKLYVRDIAGCKTEEKIEITTPDRDDWTMQGNTGTDPSTNYMGTADSIDFVIKSNNIERARVKANGDFSINRLMTNKIVSPDSVIAFGDSTVMIGYNINRIYTDNKGLGLGTQATAQGLNSLSIGNWTRTTSDAANSIAIGNHVVAGTTGSTATNAIVIGSGYGTNNTSYFHNGIANSLMIGFNSNLPTVFVSPASGSGETGNVGIGTTTLATGYKLSVKGKVIATDVYVKNFAGWPDYVFAEEHKKMSIDELQHYIDANCQLPGMPSANEVDQQESFSLGEVQLKHIEKTEELYLYVLELNKKIQTLQKENSDIKTELKKLKK